MNIHHGLLLKLPCSDGFSGQPTDDPVTWYCQQSSSSSVNGGSRGTRRPVDTWSEAKPRQSGEAAESSEPWSKPGDLSICIVCVYIYIYDMIWDLYTYVLLIENVYIPIVL